MDFAPVWYASEERLKSRSNFIVYDDIGQLSIADGKVSFSGGSTSIELSLLSQPRLVTQSLPTISYLVVNIAGQTDSFALLNSEVDARTCVPYVSRRGGGVEHLVGQQTMQIAGTLRSWCYLGLCLLFPIGAGADASAELASEARRCSNAMLVGGSDEAVSCMHPRFVELLGGTAAARENIERQRKVMAREGASIEDVSIGEPHTAIAVGNREFVLVPQTLRFKTPDGILRQSAFLLAIRESGTEDWRFIDARSSSPSSLALLFPDTSRWEFEARITIPKHSWPVLER